MDKQEVVEIINATAFEKGKTYLIKVGFEYSPPRDKMLDTLNYLHRKFEEMGVDVLLYPSPAMTIEAIEI